jgi:membrane protease YdiL (CAAX protease family)
MDQKYYSILFVPCLFLYLFLITYSLYKKEWRNVLGLSINKITKKIILKSFGIGLLIAVIVNIMVVGISLAFDQPLSNSFDTNNITIIRLLINAFLIAPILEETLFRGFIQGLLQNNYTNRNKIIIFLVALFFVISHYRYILHTEMLQCVLSLFGIFIGGLYFGYLRSKHKSIIPSLSAHLGFNTSFIIIGPILLIFLSVFKPVSIGYPMQKMNQIEYKNDSIYNFDPNDWEVLFEAQRKFLTFHNAPHPEFKQYIVKGRTVFVTVFYDIDSCGSIYNVRLIDSLYSTSEMYTSKKIETEAIRLVKSFPKHKPLIKNVTREFRSVYAHVPIYY